LKLITDNNDGKNSLTNLGIKHGRPRARRVCYYCNTEAPGKSWLVRENPSWEKNPGEIVPQQKRRTELNTGFCQKKLGAIFKAGIKKFEI
jgi:hypothetical protein